jgi:glutathione peroxidase-family protein
MLTRFISAKKSIGVLMLILFSTFSLCAQSIEGFVLPNVVDNTDFSLSDFKAERAIVITFLSGKCAFDDHYMGRVVSIRDEYSAKGVKFVLINSNSSNFVEQESIEEMKKFVSNYNLNIPYLADKEKVAKTLLKASRTPEVFVMLPDMNQFTVVYKGAIDDSPHSPSDINHNFLREALFNLLNGKKIELNQTRPVGCLIK